MLIDQKEFFNNLDGTSEFFVVIQKLDSKLTQILYNIFT